MGGNPPGGLAGNCYQGLWIHFFPQKGLRPEDGGWPRRLLGAAWQGLVEASIVEAASVWVESGREAGGVGQVGAAASTLPGTGLEAGA